MTMLSQVNTMRLNPPLKFRLQTYSARNSQQTGRIKQTCIKINEYLTKHSHHKTGYQGSANLSNYQEIDHKPSQLKQNSSLAQYLAIQANLKFPGIPFLSFPLSLFVCVCVCVSVCPSVCVRCHFFLSLWKFFG